MYKTYFHDIASHFLALRADRIPPSSLAAMRRGLLNYAGGSLYAASHDCCRPLLDFFEKLHPERGNSSVWGEPASYTPPAAAFCNAARISTLELNDGAGASSHPGIYVWSAVFAGLETYGAETGDVLRAVLFGYETAARMAKLCVNRILELGLHNPGFVGGFGAFSAMGLLRGLSIDQLENAFGLTASLSPLCPFASFIEGTDTKDFYGGWGTYLGVIAADAAANGLTGPRSVLSGVKSLESIFRGEDGLEIPFGEPYMIDSLSVKQFPACFAVNPAANAALRLREQYGFRGEDIESVLVDTYPYSYDLNQGIGRPLTRTSAKLSLHYAVAAALQDGSLGADAFLDKAFENNTYQALMDRITLTRHDAYGTGEKAVRGCIVTVTLKDGRKLSYEYDAAKHKTVWTEEMLRERYFSQVSGALSAEDAEHLYDLIMALSPETPLREIIGILNRVKKADA